MEQGLFVVTPAGCSQKSPKKLISKFYPFIRETPSQGQALFQLGYTGKIIVAAKTPARKYNPHTL